jgi:hypothetical protein
MKAAGSRFYSALSIVNYPLSIAVSLSKTQCAAVCASASAAWRALGKPGASLDDWRRAEQASVTGRASLKDCHPTGPDFQNLLSHFRALSGDSGAAFQSAMKAQEDEGGKAVALHKLRTALAAADKPEAYAAAIARNKFCQGNLALLSAKQIWQLFYTINKAAGKARKPIPAKAKAKPAPAATPAPRDESDVPDDGIPF